MQQQSSYNMYQLQYVKDIDKMYFSEPVTAWLLLDF